MRYKVGDFTTLFNLMNFSLKNFPVWIFYKNSVFWCEQMFPVKKKYCQSPCRSIMGWQRHHWTSRTQNAANIRRRSYDETPLADSCGSSVVHTCKGKAISLPLKFLPFSNRPLFHSSPNKSHFPHSILALSNKRRKFRQKHPMSAITYISTLEQKWTPNQVDLINQDPQHLLNNPVLLAFFKASFTVYELNFKGYFCKQCNV